MKEAKIISGILIGILIAVLLNTGFLFLLPHDMSFLDSNTIQIQNEESSLELEEINIDNIQIPKYYKLTDEKITEYINNKLVLFGRANPMVFLTKKEEPVQEQGSNNENSQNGALGQNLSAPNIFIKGYALPVDKDMFFISSPYGQRTNPFTKQPEMHRGIDIYAPDIKGKPVYAFLKGIVEFAGENGDYGNYVVINHGNCKTVYAHLMSIDSSVKVGEVVNTGQVIGLVGDTGKVTGPHLHFELLIGSVKVDPLPYLIMKLLETDEVLETEVVQQE